MVVEDGERVAALAVLQAEVAFESICQSSLGRCVQSVGMAAGRRRVEQAGASHDLVQVLAAGTLV
ncbi:MAG: hypothetical protein IPP19_06165 [Verrucomicrobia bacterium]|nr:hypothetical protein [Verrucomicrobiota bacterium]